MSPPPLPSRQVCGSHDELIKSMQALERSQKALERSQLALESRQDSLGTDNALILEKLGNAGDGLGKLPSGMTGIMLRVQNDVSELKRDRVKLDSLVDEAEEAADTAVEQKTARVIELEAKLTQLTREREEEHRARDAAWKRTVATILIALVTGAGGAGVVRDALSLFVPRTTTQQVTK